MIVARGRDLPLVEWRPGVSTRLYAAGSTGADALCVMEQLCDPGTGAPPHRHEGIEEVLLVLGGRARVHVGDEESELAAGDSVVVPAGSRHGFRNVGAAGLRILAIFAAATPRAEYEDEPGVVLEVGGHGTRRRDAHRAEREEPLR
jgi:mannose-6-phosphate isomerase-like protein (cupin superfamily)